MKENIGKKYKAGAWLGFPFATFYEGTAICLDEYKNGERLFAFQFFKKHGGWEWKIMLTRRFGYIKESEEE